MYISRVILLLFSVHFKMAKRSDLTLLEKIRILNRIRSQPPQSRTLRTLSELFSVPKSTIGRIQSQEQALRQKFLEEKDKARNGFRKRERGGKDSEVDNALNQWFKTILHKGVRISGLILKAKAEEFAEKLGQPDFLATEGWLSRWKGRCQIRCKQAHGEKASADFGGAEVWKSTKIHELLSEYNPCDIYNADETGLYYRATPDNSLCYTYEQLSGSKRQWNVLQSSCVSICLVVIKENFS